MPHPHPHLVLPPAGSRGPRVALAYVREFLVWTWAGRVLLASLALWLLSRAGVPLPCGLDVIAIIVLVFFFAWGLWRATAWFLRRLLWRIRTKLLVSYLFIAVVPLVLLAILFLLGGLFFSGLVASHVVISEVGRESESLGALARQALAAMEHGTLSRDGARLTAAARAIHPQAGWAIVREGRVMAAEGTEVRELPAWIPAEGFHGPVRDGDKDWLRAVAREGGAFVLVEAPLDEHVYADLEERMGIRLVSSGGDVEVRESGITVRVDDDDPRRTGSGELRRGKGMPFIATLKRHDWATGQAEDHPVAIQFDSWALVSRLSPGVKANMGEMFAAVMAAVAGAFLAFYCVALALGLVLARSITRSVHELYRGTERVRSGDYGHPIRVHSRDQLGELAESFNAMSDSVREALNQRAEKERLEEELRIAREIQMSLLPQGSVTLPGLRVAAMCLPAAEVGGDYYDLLPLSPTRMGVLVADVSGKGTSAALYMAELKGLVLSLSRIHESPARLLVEANRILAGAMDVRSFITMTYAVVDVQARVMRFARAGHNPILHLHASTGRVETLLPPGLGLGLDRGDRFDDLLQEVQVPLESGDVFLFFTDGLSEAMNLRSELFGEQRLREVLESAGREDADWIKERILQEIRGFVGEAVPHDDMTLVLLRVL